MFVETQTDIPRRSEQELAINIKKATNPDETAPKRKHVRAAIVYSWDTKNGNAIFAALKVCVCPQRVLFRFRDDETYHHRLYEKIAPEAARTSRSDRRASCEVRICQAKPRRPMILRQSLVRRLRTTSGKIGEQADLPSGSFIARKEQAPSSVT